MKTASLWLDAAPDAKRYPALSGAVSADVIVIGAGMVGLLAAWELAEMGKKVVLLERNRIGTGDTGSTTGFLTRVPDTTLHKLAERHSDALVRDVFVAMRDAQQGLFDLIKGQRIDCEFASCDSFYGAYAADDALLEKEWRIISTIEKKATLVTSEEFERLSFAKAVRIQGEGRFHARKFLVGLAERCVAKGVRIFEDSEVTGLDWSGSGVAVRTKGGTVSASRTVLAVGDPSGLIPSLASLVEGRLSFVIAARFASLPILPHQFWDTGDPYFYFRSTDANTVIVGGCDVTQNEGMAHKPFDKLQEFAATHLGKGFETTHQWSGSLFETKDGLPFAFEHPHLAGKVYVATGLGGNGMVGGALAAHTAAQLAGEGRAGASKLLSPERLGIKLSQPQAVKAAVVPPTGPRTFVALCRADEVKPGRPVCKTVNGQKLAVFAINGKYHAIKNTCTHMGGPLCEGTLDKNIVTCPWHGAKFDVTSGQVMGPPATRNIETFRVRESGGKLEVEVGSQSDRASRWHTLLCFAGLVFVFLGFQFLGQYFIYSKGLLEASLVRSFALTGATLIGLALFSSAVFKWRPHLASQWRFRRYLGVSGVICILFHILSVEKFYFNFDLNAIFFSFNPFVNPIVFGSIAFPIFLIMAMTSTDWAVAKLTPQRWKNIHRLVYIAYLAAIFHFILMKGATLYQIFPGQLLLAVTAAAVFGQIFWFFKIASKARFRSWGTVYGFALMALALYGIWRVVVS